MNDQVTASTTRALQTRGARAASAIASRSARGAPRQPRGASASPGRDPRRRAAPPPRRDRLAWKYRVRHDGGAALKLRCRAFQLHAERAEQLFDLTAFQLEPLSFLTSLGSKANGAFAFGGLPAISTCSLPAANVEHHPRRKLEPRHHEGRIDAALESEARIGLNIELAAGARRALRIEIGRLDKDVGGRTGRDRWSSRRSRRQGQVRRSRRR